MILDNTILALNCKDHINKTIRQYFKLIVLVFNR
jgi:hypothetical protein